MNEQQLADLFSEQIDRMLQGQQPVMPAGAADLQPLLALGQQFSQVNFQPGAAAQAAFQSQLSGWFGPLNGGTATAAWGLSKTLFLTLAAAAITIGAVAGSVIFFVPAGSWFEPQPQIAPDEPAVPQEPLEIPAPEKREPTAVPPTPAAPAKAPVAGGDTISPSSSSKGDTLAPGASSLEDTLPLPASEPTPTATSEIVQEPGTDTVDDSTSDGDGSGSTGGGAGDGSSPTGDHDKGHGNDADGVDEDNPGKSNGLPGGGQGSNSGGSDFSEFSGGNGGGNGGGNNSGGNGGGRGNSGGQGKGKGNQ